MPVVSVIAHLCFVGDVDSAESRSDGADADAGLPPGNDLAQDGEFGVIEEQITAFGAGGRYDDAFAQVEIEVGAGETGGGTKIAGHEEALERAEIIPCRGREIGGLVGAGGNWVRILVACGRLLAHLHPGSVDGRYSAIA